MSTPAGAAHLVGPSTVGDLNRWAHLAAVYDGATMRSYRDGQEVASRGQTGAVLSETTPFVVGGGDHGGVISEHIDAILDDVRLYNRALPAAGIRNLVAMGGAVARVASFEEVDGSAASAGGSSCGQPGIEVLALFLLRRVRR